MCQLCYCTTRCLATSECDGNGEGEAHRDARLIAEIVAQAGPDHYIKTVASHLTTCRMVAKYRPLAPILRSLVPLSVAGLGDAAPTQRDTSDAK
jgi:hypothetical protein